MSKILQSSLFGFVLIVLAFGNSFGQLIKPPVWSYSYSKEEVKVGEEVELIFSARIPINWYIYGNDFDPNLGPGPTIITLVEDPSFLLVGGVEMSKPKRKYDDIFEMDISYFEGLGEFRQKIKVLNTRLNISGEIDYQMCTDIDGRCVPFDHEFTFTAPISIILPASSSVSENQTETIVEDSTVIADSLTVEEGTEASTFSTSPEQLSREDRERGFLATRDVNDAYSLLAFMIISFLAGLAALLTPCVFPMIPLTVSFFTGKSKTRKQAIGQALFYGFSIIAIYTLAGTIVSRVNGPEFANFLSTHWVPNVAFFLIFIFFALAFLGMFEITLPSGFVNKIDKQADKGGLYGTFFMAFTLVLVSFSCTGPIVGSILVESAGGMVLKPILGMFAFSLAFAIPFTLFAIFPEWMNNLPKSGGWLNTVKVFLGFLELALAFKFLSIADLAYHWNLLDRNLFLVIWISVFLGLAFYLFGMFRMPGDSKSEHISVPRLLLALTTLGFVIYMLPGLWGAPLRGLSGFLPPMKSGMYSFNGGGVTAAASDEEFPCGVKPRFSDLLEIPHGIAGYFDYNEAIACAKAQNKPLFIDFTGHGCVNCREMEAKVWSDPEVLRRLKNDFVVLALYVDDKTELPESEWYTSSYDSKVKKTIGRQNADFQITRFNNNAQPYYIILGKNEEMLIAPKAYDLSIPGFVQFLDEAKAVFEATN
jgi:thiol:disulfide interchange protein